MSWNDMTRDEMEAQLLRQAQTIGEFRRALEKIASDQYGSLGCVEIAKKALQGARHGYLFSKSDVERAKRLAASTVEPEQ